MTNPLDQHVMDWLVGHRAVGLTSAARGLQRFGDWTKQIGAVISIGLFLIPRRRAVAVAMALAGVSALVATTILKHLFDRPRPPRPPAIVGAFGPSFPSSTAAVTAAVVLVVVALLAWPSPRWRRPGIVIGSAAIALSSWAVMYLGAHWLTDVLAGWLLGTIVAVACSALAKRLVPAIRDTTAHVSRTLPHKTGHKRP